MMFGSLLVDIHGNDRRAFFAITCRNAPADTDCTAGDENNLIRQLRNPSLFSAHRR